MKGLMMKCAAGLSLISCFAGLATADSSRVCSDKILRGQYIFTATGFYRAPTAGPADPWFPKALIHRLAFNGDGTLTTPRATIANRPPSNAGQIFQPKEGGAAGTYAIREDCSGTVKFGHDDGTENHILSFQLDIG